MRLKPSRVEARSLMRRGVLNFSLQKSLLRAPEGVPCPVGNSLQQLWRWPDGGCPLRDVRRGAKRRQPPPLLLHKKIKTSATKEKFKMLCNYNYVALAVWLLVRCPVAVGVFLKAAVSEKSEDFWWLPKDLQLFASTGHWTIACEVFKPEGCINGLCRSLKPYVTS